MPGCDRTPQSAEDQSVTIVEHMLDEAASRGQPPIRPPVGRTASRHALAICACVSGDDAPNWLIYEDSGGDLAWCRVPEGTDPVDLVDAELYAAGHADPGEVLRRLRGDATDPWAGGGDEWGDLAAIEKLGRKIRQQ